MASKYYLLCVVIMMGLIAPSAPSGLKRICYYASTNDADADLPIKAINGTLCTHLIIGFAIVVNKSITPARGINDTIIYEQAVQLKGTYPHLKVMLSIGGGGAESGFHDAVNDVASRSAFTLSVYHLLINYGFDGVDIDWEFPAWSKHDQDRGNFVHLLKELRNIFDANFQDAKFRDANLSDSKINQNSRPNGIKERKRLLLSVAVAAQLTIITTSYDISSIVKYVDFINIMSYDYHDYTPYLPFIEFNAPLFSRPSELGYLATLNTNWSAFYWLSQGAPKDKLMIGIPTYSHNYILADAQKTIPGSPSLGDASEFSYSDVCFFLSSRSTVYRFDGDASVPYAYNGYLWSSFEDRFSISRKVAWVKANAFGGVMTYNLNNDDHKGACANVRFPLQSIVYEILEDANN